MIRICVPTLTQYDLLEKLIASSKSKAQFIIMDNGGNFCPEEALDISEIEEARDPAVIKFLNLSFHQNKDRVVFSPEVNLGVAASWNWFLQNIPPNDGNYWIISNDDVELTENTLDIIEEYAPKNPITLPYDSEWAFFAIRKDTIEKVGYFDENFYPAYFEDNDYHHRMKLNNLDVVSVNELRHKHVVSATLKSYSSPRKEQHHREFRRNREYFRQKWGFIPG
jgi:GT2 family glycosyltransferase